MNVNTTLTHHDSAAGRAGAGRILGACWTALLVWVAAAAPAQQPPAPASAPAKAAAKGAEIDIKAGCVTADCHGDMKQAKYAHGPVNLNQCEPCHIPEGGRHAFKKITDTRSLCFTCHQVDKPKKVVHKPFAADCTMCHNPHKGDNQVFVKGGTGAEGCKQCHNDVTKGLNFMHGPVGQGECLACHSPHQSENSNLLVETGSKLCESCHTDFSATMAGAVSVHKPVKDSCQSCHGAHGGNTKNFLKAQGGELCKQCHADVLKGIEAFKHPHQPMIEGRSCEHCHQPHASKQEKLLVSTNESLCLNCHNKTIQTKAGVELPSIADQLKNAKFMHGPLRQQNCIACHKAHGSDFANILEKAFPANFYEPYQEKAYDLCFNCHDKKIVLDERSTLTGFRNGDQNLHYLHVNREKGRSCRACHHEHASNQPKHVRDAVPFGRWVMHTTYTKNESGGGCTTGCHLPYKYDRNTAVSNQKAK